MRFNAGGLDRVTMDPVPSSTNVRSCQVTSMFTLISRRLCLPAMTPSNIVLNTVYYNNPFFGTVAGFRHQIMEKRALSDTRKMVLTCRSTGNPALHRKSKRILVARGTNDSDMLRQENAAMREHIRSLIAEHSDLKSQLAQHLEEHAALTHVGREIGEHIPSITDEDQKKPVEVEAESMDTTEQGATSTFLDRQDVVMEVEGDETLVFKFHDTPVVSNNVMSSSMSSSSDRWTSAPGDASAKSGSTTSLSSAAPAPVEKSAQELAIEAANKEVEHHTPSTVAQGKEDWLFMTVPSMPVAGAKVVLYFNREQSQPLQHRPRVELYFKFNNWELDMDGSDRIDMDSVGALAPGTNFFKAELVIPQDAYEMNFIFSDKEETYDNNESKNYSFPVKGDMTKAMWIDTAPERAEAEFLKRKELERLAAEKAEEERERAALERDVQKAQDIVNHLKYNHEELRKNAAMSFNSDSGAEILVAQQKTTRASEQIKIMYNKNASCLASIDAASSPIKIRVGHNGWQSPVDVPMKLAKAKPGKQNVSDTEEWWEAVVKVPLDALALNLVVFCDETFDNNQGNDYCLFVDRGKDIATWADSILQPLKKIVTDARRQEEERLKEFEQKKAEERQAVRVRVYVYVKMLSKIIAKLFKSLPISQWYI